MGERTPIRATDVDGLTLGDLPFGARIGDYRVDGRLPSRGTGNVYEATHLILPRRVTIKVMPAAHGWTRDVALGLLREACIVEALDHPGIPRVHECGLLPDRRPWIATELIDGTTLATAAGRSRFTAHEVATLIRDVSDILAHAHGRGLIHRNVLPTTIVIPARTRRFPVCLVDWQGTRTHDSTSPLPLQVSEANRRYLAPELVELEGDVVDSRADVYALGVIARELLAGTSHAMPEIPPLLAALVRRMRAADPAARPTSDQVYVYATWVASNLAPAADRHSGEVEPPAVEPVEPATERSAPRVISSDMVGQVSGELDVR